MLKFTKLSTLCFLVATMTDFAAAGSLRATGDPKEYGDTVDVVDENSSDHQDERKLLFGIGTIISAGVTLVREVACEAGGVGDECFFCPECQSGLTCDIDQVCRAPGKTGDGCNIARKCASGYTCTASFICIPNDVAECLQSAMVTESNNPDSEAMMQALTNELFDGDHEDVMQAYCDAVTSYLPLVQSFKASYEKCVPYYLKDALEHPGVLTVGISAGAGFGDIAGSVSAGIALDLSDGSLGCWVTACEETLFGAAVGVDVSIGIDFTDSISGLDGLAYEVSSDVTVNHGIGATFSYSPGSPATVGFSVSKGFGYGASVSVATCHSKSTVASFTVNGHTALKYQQLQTGLRESNGQSYCLDASSDVSIKKCSHLTTKQGFSYDGTTEMLVSESQVGYCLANKGAYKRSDLHIVKCDTNDTTQKWSFDDNNGVHAYNSDNTESDYCIRVVGTTAQDSQRVYLWPCRKSTVMMWKLNEGVGKFMNQKLGGENNHYCMHLKKSSPDDVYIRECSTYTRYQEWSYDAYGRIVYGDNKKLCLQRESNGKRANMSLKTCSNSYLQRWILDNPNGNGVIRAVTADGTASSRCVRVPGDTMKNDAVLYLWDCDSATSSNSMKWSWQYVGEV